MTDMRQVAGWPIKGAAADIESIGAGGGSVAWIDAGGLLRVGPHSAGSTPGPACYGRGGELPTITDANLVLGRLDSLLGGEYPLRRDLAIEAIERHVAAPLSLSVNRAAEGILAVATAHMEQAIRLMTVARGYDPREFVLVTFGGAGALHGPAVARNLGIRRVLVPGSAGVLSARGVLGSRLTKEFSATKVIPLLESNLPGIAVMLSDLRVRAERWLAEQAARLGERRGDGATLRASVDVRCHGQNYELSVPLSLGAELAPGAGLPHGAGLPPGAGSDLGGSLTEGFHAAHEKAYGYAFIGAPLECVTFRVGVELHGTSLDLESLGGVRTRASGATGVDETGPATRPVVWVPGSEAVATPVYRALPPGTSVAGPAIIERDDATVTIWPGQVARAVAGSGVLIDTLASLDHPAVAGRVAGYNPGGAA
jgi:N-methylhydantoinase A